MSDLSVPDNLSQLFGTVKEMASPIGEMTARMDNIRALAAQVGEDETSEVLLKSLGPLLDNMSALFGGVGSTLDLTASAGPAVKGTFDNEDELGKGAAESAFKPVE